jgi:hypothetical protein
MFHNPGFRIDCDAEIFRADAYLLRPLATSRTEGMILNLSVCPRRRYAFDFPGAYISPDAPIVVVILSESKITVIAVERILSMAGASRP